MLVLGRGEVSNGMEACFQQPPLAMIIGIKTANLRMLFQDKDLLTKAGEADSGCQS